ncbi:unnamed protein product [Protopolystoma xenopodis]|uniref:Uncharacterized protein n=1 Tax=Protopolystoma xenopodis TaxID=117903 RepID=A0A3S5ACT5_9PLAT|nr:unnamed protein product [Protopolystoma xenopodis]
MVECTSVKQAFTGFSEFTFIGKSPCLGQTVARVAGTTWKEFMNQSVDPERGGVFEIPSSDANGSGLYGPNTSDQMVGACLASHQYKVVLEMRHDGGYRKCMEQTSSISQLSEGLSVVMTNVKTLLMIGNRSSDIVLRLGQSAVLSRRIWTLSILFRTRIPQDSGPATKSGRVNLFLCTFGGNK